MIEKTAENALIENVVEIALVESAEKTAENALIEKTDEMTAKMIERMTEIVTESVLLIL